MAAARTAVSPTKGRWDYTDTQMKVQTLNGAAGEEMITRPTNNRARAQRY